MFTKEIEQQFIQHALEVYPNECCGLIVDGGAAYVPFKNVHEAPRMNFRLNNPDFMEYYNAGRVAALMHSHTAPRNNFPSRSDMVAQENMQLPWGIVHINPDRDFDGPFYFGDSIEIAPFVGRPWRDNIYDCYTLLRDVFRVEENITLPIFPREGEWWKAKQNFLEDNFLKAGFQTIDATQLRKNDVMLGRVLSPMDNPVMNHIMIVRDRGLVLHHLKDRLSRHDPYSQWKNTATKYVRYVGEGK